MGFGKSMLAGTLSAGIFSFFIVSPGLAQDQIDSENGWYVGFSTPITAIMGGFTGDKALVGTGDTVYVPDVDPGVGLGLTIGAREDFLAFEVSFMRSLHRGKSRAGSGDVRFNLISFDLKFLGSPEERLQPFLLIGLNIPRLFFEDGSVGSTSVGRAKFSGFGGNFGGGVSYTVNPRVSFVLGLTYRLIRYVSVSGVGDGARDIGSFSGDSITLNPKIMVSF